MAEIEDLKIVGGSTYTVGNQDIIANEWEAGKTYVKGKSYVIREHRLYVCNVTHTSVEPFDATKWTAITVGEAIAANTTAIGDLSQLTTTDKSSLVGAVNEVNSVETKTLATNATYYKTSKVVQVSLVGYSVPANTGSYSTRHIIGYLPVGYRPIVNAYAPYISNNIKTLMIQANGGEVSIRNSSGSAEDAYISLTFLTN